MNKNYERQLIEACIDPLVVIDTNGMISDVNEAMITTTGISRKILIGSNFSNYFTDFQKAQDAYETALREGYIRNYNLCMKHIDNSLIEVLYNATVITDQNRNVFGVFAVARDITELKKAQDEIKKLRGILPICAKCKKIRNSKGDWIQLESYIKHHSEADFSHGLCMDCAKELYPDMFDKNGNNS